MSAKHSGQSARALDLLSMIVARYPSSALAESARVEQIRITKATDPARASRLAAQYLERYPRGFARAEVEAVASGQP
jgi:outer membrane protein assembly factor BamD (BamD/ComL family)